MRAIVVAAISVAVVLVAAGSGGSTTAAVQASVPVSLIGANYTHYVNPSCSLDYGIVTHYDWTGVRRRVRAQLAAMRAAGIQSLRLLLWYMSDATGQNWGIVSSGGGRLGEPYRSNLIHYLSDVRQAGIEQLTLAFGPPGRMIRSAPTTTRRCLTKTGSSSVTCGRCSSATARRRRASI
jgi:hypothetical protein